jgi:hypothetical protein
MATCTFCGSDHAPHEPHRLTPQYETWFYGRYGRWPTEADAASGGFFRLILDLSAVPYYGHIVMPPRDEDEDEPE